MNHARQRAFTSIELILVIVIVGILAAVAAPRFFNTGAFSERAYFDAVSAALRYAQKVSVASGCRVRIDLNPDSYVLTQQAAVAGHCDPNDASYPLAVQLANGSPMSGTAPSGVTLAPALSVEFDALGRTNLGVDQLLTVGSWSLLITAESGLVITL